MIVDTHVRLQPADLAQMSVRLQSLLTPEGARAWYAHDVAELLQEVVALRQDLYDGRAALGAPAESTEGLAELAERWKIEASGIWEKAQYKQLRAQVKELQQIDEERAATIASMVERAAILAAEREIEREAWAAQIEDLNRSVSTATESIEALQQQRYRLQTDLNTAAHALKDATARADTEAMACALKIEAIKTTAREALAQVVESTLS